MSFWSKLRYKWRRLEQPAGFKHHAQAHSGFDLHGDPAGVQTIHWRRRIVGQTAALAAARDTCSGECFIVCSGPSLGEVDLGQLAGRACIGVNGAIARFKQCGVRPTFYAITDPDFFEHRFGMVRDVVLSGAASFFSFVGLSRISEREPGLLAGRTVYRLDAANHQYGVRQLTRREFAAQAASEPDFVLHPTRPPHEDAVGFSKNSAKGVFCGRNIAFRALQVAYHLGFRRVHLVGMDLGGSGSLVRFYETKHAGRMSGLDRHYKPFILPAFEVVRELQRREPFEVYNLSPQSRLPHDLVTKLDFASALQMNSSSQRDGVAA